MENMLSIEEYNILSDKFTRLEIHLNKIDQKLDILLNTTDKVDDVICDIHKSTSNMDNHITFVETVYDTVSAPLYYIANQFSKTQIPEIKYKSIKAKTLQLKAD